MSCLYILEINPCQLHGLQMFTSILRLSFCFVDGFLCCAKALRFDQAVHSSLSSCPWKSSSISAAKRPHQHMEAQRATPVRPSPLGHLTSLEQVLALITAFQYSIFDTHSIWLWSCLAPRVPEAVWSSGSKPLWRYWPRWDSLVQKVPTDKGCDKSPACILQLRLCSCQKHIIFPKGNSSDHVVCRPASPQALTTANCEPMPSCSSSETLSVWQLCRMLTSLT